MDGYLEQLRSFPQDLSTLPEPHLQEQDRSVFADALLALAAENPSASSRHCILQAASLIPPRTAFSATSLAWVNDEDEPSTGRKAIVRYSSSALSQGIFPAGEWFQALSEASAQRPRLHDVMIQWSRLSFEVSSVVRTAY
ncbi:hypothetical protein IAR55_000355 [Kwoniella newhampshirensis]|uniref:Importin N-terminal domain-containing protein n=1 Tax=Kwoniella newhampshirensis TaxID=1651941 RepID=A0AAW0Z6D8_9TREE